MQVGSTLPEHCRSGQLFFLTTAPAGQNLYGCSGTAWANQSGDPALIAGSGLARIQNGNMVVWSADSTTLPYLALDNAFLGNNAFAGKISTTPAAAQSLVPTDTIDVRSGTVHPLTAAAAVQLSSTPTIPSGDDGQHIYLINTGAAGITLQDSTRLAGTNLCLSGRENMTLASKTMAHLVYSAAAGCWIQVMAGSAVAGSPPVVSGGLQREFLAAACQYAVGTLGSNAQTADAPAPDCVIGANGTVYGVAKFSNSATQRLYFSLDLPATVNTVTIGLPWRARVAGGSVAWQVRYLIVPADGSSTDDPDLNALGATAAAPAVAAVSGKLLQSEITLSPAGAGGGRMYFTVLRAPGAAGDTFNDATHMPELAKVVVKVQ